MTRLYNVYTVEHSTGRRMRVAKAVKLSEALDLMNRYSRSAHMVIVDIVPLDEDPDYFDEDGYLDGIDSRR